MRLLLAALALTSGGCTTGAPPPMESVPVAEPGSLCDAARPQELIGRQASPAVAREARRLSGARTARFLRPGQIVTMEYRADRLNLHLDAQDKGERIICG